MTLARSIRRRARVRGPAVRRAPAAGAVARRAQAKAAPGRDGGVALGGVHDPEEKDADRMAAQAMSAPPVRRKCAACEGEEEGSGPARREVAGGGGSGGGGSASGGSAPAGAARAIAAMGPGTPMAPAHRAFFEPRFGADFSGVRVHDGPDADSAARSIGARAFALGPDIAFARGEPRPGTPEGDRLMAHELAHTLQDEMSFEAGQGRLRREEKADGDCPKDKLDKIAQQYADIEAEGRKKGFAVAADNLAHFVAGSGSKRVLSTTWLRGFPSALEAEQVNQGRFESQLNDKANDMADGSTDTLSDHWSRQFTAGRSEELYYASGTSTIKSVGKFALSRDSKRQVSISGKVAHHWYDPYDWHPGLAAYIPGFGSISDADALLLQKCRGAKAYDMESDWTQSLSATIDVGYVWNTKKFSWSGP